MAESAKYEEAMSRLEEIVRQMESDELDIDVLGEKLREAQRLAKMCKAKLTKTDEEIRKILGEEK